jgi:hypothetical protein
MEATHVVACVGQVRHLRSGAAEDYPAWPLESLFTREGSTALDLTLVEIHDNSIDHLRRYIELLFGVGAEQAHQLTDGDSQ